MNKSYVDEVSTGSYLTYLVGGFYILEDEKAAQFIAEGLAIDPDNPPVPQDEYVAEEDTPAEEGAALDA